MISLIVSVLVQVLVVLVLAFAVWGIRGRKRSGFFTYVGLTRAPFWLAAAAFAFGCVNAVALLQIDALTALGSGDNSVVAATRGMNSTEMLMAIGILAVFKTAFSEELLFRGVLGKRLIAMMGFAWGNSVQALLFGAVHLLLLLSPHATVTLVAMMVAVTAVQGFINGWLNEKWAAGSILPGWAAHAGANLTSYLILAAPLWVGR